MPLKLYLSGLNLSFSWLNLGLPFCDGPWPSCFCPSSYLRTCLYFLSEPIPNRLPQRHHQELPPNHNSPPTSTCSTVLSFGDSAIFSPYSVPTLPLQRYLQFQQTPMFLTLNRIRASTEMFLEIFSFYGHLFLLTFLVSTLLSTSEVTTSKIH